MTGLRWCGRVVTLLAVGGCMDQEGPTELRVPDAMVAIVDAAHHGLAGFYFLTPIVREPNTSGTFDATLLDVLEVEICLLKSGECGDEVAAFSSSTGPGSETIRLDETAEQYVVNWHTGDLDADESEVYRIVVRAAGSTMGHADVLVTSGGRELKNAETGDLVPLVDGRTLPIKFRIETGAVSVVGEEGGSVAVAGGAAVLTVPPGAVDGSVGITVTPVDSPVPGVVQSTTFDFGPDGLVFAQPVELAITFDPADLEHPEDAVWLRIHELAGTSLEQLPGSSVDVASSVVRARVTHFTMFTVAVASSFNWTVDQLDARLRGVWAASATEAFAVGFDPIRDEGVIYHYAGGSWSPTWSSGDDGYVTDVWGFAPNDVYATAGGIVHYTDTGWEWEVTFPSPGTYLYRIWGSAPDDIYACGADESASPPMGVLLHSSDGATWTQAAFQPAAPCADIGGTGQGDVFVVFQDQIVHYTGTAWEVQEHPPFSFELAEFSRYHGGGIWGTPGSDMYALGGDEACGPYTVLRYDGMWHEESFGTGVEYPARLWGISDSEIYAIVGSVDPCDWSTDTFLYRYDGTEWSPLLIDNSGILAGWWNDIHGVDPDAVFAVSRLGYVLMGQR